MSKQTYRVCCCFWRRFRLAAAEAPADVKEIFEDYSSNGVMSVDQLRRFLVEVQGEENATMEDAQSVMDGLKHLHIFHRRGLNLEAFFKYLLGDVNPPLDPKIGVHHDMTAPLSHYFIYSTHNTYLTGNQVSSNSSDIPIIRALEGGVRVVELDIWPNSTKSNVQVRHGRTLTTPVEFIKCLRSIKEHAFSVSEYPVIITLEDHLTPDLQALAAEMITQTFGDMLFSPGSEILREFPSPESLKGRVIISTKPPKEYLSKKVKVIESNSKKEQSSTEDETGRKEVSDFKPKNDYHKDDDMDGDGIDTDEDDEEDPKLQLQVAPVYRNLIAILAGKGKGSMQEWLRIEPNRVRRLSLQEHELEKAITENGKDIVRFTQQNLLRVFPKGIRLDSSNFNPLSAWMHGAQMVAVNMQGYGKSLWLMHGMFRANGGCGYVKKPDCLLKSGSNGEVFNPRANLPVKTTLRVTLYMGEGWYYDFSHTHFDTYSPPDFYAKVEIAGVPTDTTKKKTKIMVDNWIPTWDEVFVFPLTVPELAFLRIRVRDYNTPGKAEFGGQTCLPNSFPISILLLIDRDRNVETDVPSVLLLPAAFPPGRGGGAGRYQGDFPPVLGERRDERGSAAGVHHDMSAPLSHYFIYTGHNSYLTGNQLSSDCSDVPIINALHRGVRVIELDIWPNSTKNNVNVLHGRTLTTPVELIKCLRSIKEHAFIASQYPVVITLEDHLTPDLQAKTAEMITQTFGDMLFSPGSECLSEFPSPEFLKKRVIISTKPPKEYLKAKDAKAKESDLEKGKDSAKEEPWGRELTSFKAKRDDKLLIAIHAGKGKGGMEDWLRVDPGKVRRLSLSEQELEKAIDTYGKDIVRFTQRNILRVYPKGIRFDSSNYNPLIGWMHGAQMVAFNMQGYGRSLWLMHGMFRANGGCGYVKKPKFLLKADSYGEVFDPSIKLPVKTTLKVTVYMGEGWYYDFSHSHFDTYSPPDFYARIGIAGVRADVVMKKTKTLEDNWIPTWDEVFEFPLTVPELALLRIEVHEHDMSEKDDFAGQTCLPVSELRKGIRAVPLHSHKGVKYNSVKLLMRFEFI
ncbi:hypothetical protein BUALT_Bualt06G0056100 [Buddleja alternifolia]|uniref:Phosphoinositide phospholipase C n=1 Tax=Buddleja alternifolia TaxID=168488 RepID=A0AAV6XD15_9LAMI|nr:hypothetical protein BUALT_Bualt06G0056100 [Buddleja alternifolia]